MSKRFPVLFSRVSVALLLGFAVTAQAQTVPQWSAYDETADLALLAQHADDSMHFKLLNSKVLDKNSLWAPFNSALANFTEERYQSLKPLILEQSIATLQAAVASGALDYETLVLFYIYRIRAIESDNSLYLNAIISLNPDAVARARSLDQQRRQGLVVARDSLFGMPVLLKDNVGFAGMATTAGAVALQNNVTANAFIADQLTEQGAIILGKANLSEWAYFFCNDCPSGYSAMGGQTLNPYGRFDFSTGGSSAGSGASVAANYAVAAVGSETSGSILSPSSANSLVGLKPTTGSLSRTGIVPISATLDTAGPMARTVADVVILFNAMAGYDAADAAMPMLTADYQLEYRTVSLAGKRLGVLNNLSDNTIYQDAVDLLQENGASMIALDLENGPFPRFTEFLGAEMKRDLANYLAGFAGTAISLRSIGDVQAFNAQNPVVRAPYAQGLIDMMVETKLSTAEIEALREELQSLARSQLDRVFAEHQLDVLLSVNNGNAGLAALANYPALTIPAGYLENGRPVGLTLIAPGFSEQQLIDVGATFETLSRARRAAGGYR